MIKKVLNNIISILIGKGFEMILSFIAITLIARYLGVSQYGIFTSTVSLVYIISKTIDFGFFQIVFRENSIDNKNFKLLNSALSFRLILFIVVVFVYNVLSFIIEIQSTEVFLTNILFVNIIISAKFRNVRELLEVPFKVDLSMKYIMFVNVLDNLLLVLFIFTAVTFDLDINGIVLLYVLSNLPGFLVMLFLLIKHFNYKFSFSLDKSSWLIRESYPLYGAVVLIAIFQQLDVILVKNLVSDFQAGIYAAALRIATPLNILPLALITTLFPVIAKNKSERPETSRIAQRLVYKILFTVSFLVFIVMIFRAEEIVPLIFGREYQESWLPLVIIVFGYTFFYLNNLTQNIFTIYNNQKYNFTYTALIVLLNLLLLVMLLISYESVGAAIARTTSTIIGSIYLFVIMRKLGVFTNFINLFMILCLAACIAFSFFMVSINLVLYIIIIIIISLGIIIFSKFFTTEELLLISKIFKIPTWIKNLKKI